MTAWLKQLPKDVAFKRVPVVFQDSFVPPQKLYYTLEAMGQLDTMHSKAFNAIHVEHQKLDKDALVIDWAAKQGLDKAKFTEIYQSFSVATKVRKAAQLQEAYQVAGVPAMGVAGQFYTDGTQAQSMERGLKVGTTWWPSSARPSPEPGQIRLQKARLCGLLLLGARAAAFLKSRAASTSTMDCKIVPL